MMSPKDPFNATQAQLFSDTRTLSVYHAGDFVAACGANQGDGLGIADDLMLDDIYILRRDAERRSLVLRQNETGYEVSANSGLGGANNRVHLDCSLTLMDLSNAVVEALVLVEVDTAEHVESVYLLALAPISFGREYHLLNVDRSNAAQKIAHLSCASFTRGTRITLGSGRQRAVEDLSVGTPLLTRDNGVQPIRWIGQYTERATGAFAPIRFSAGTLNNSDDLVVSPDHRLFFYRREGRVGAVGPEIMVRARHLVNGHTITVHEGGFVDYFQILFNAHQVVYADGVATESAMTSETNVPLIESELPADFLSMYTEGNALGSPQSSRQSFSGADPRVTLNLKNTTKT